MSIGHPRSYAAIVADIGEKLYGSTWVEYLSQALQVSKRGVERTKAAASAYDDYASAKGYLDGLRELLDERRARLAGLSRELDEAIARRAAERDARP